MRKPAALPLRPKRFSGLSNQTAAQTSVLPAKRHQDCAIITSAPHRTLILVKVPCSIWSSISALPSRLARQGLRAWMLATVFPKDIWIDPMAAAELVGLIPDVIVATVTPAAVATKALTTSIPIVCPLLADAISLGLIASEARPGGNVTGVSFRT